MAKKKSGEPLKGKPSATTTDTVQGAIVPDTGLAPRTVARRVITTWSTSREDADLNQLARDVAPMFADQLLNESDEDFCERIADTTMDEFLRQADDAPAAACCFRFVVTIDRR